MLGWFLTGVHIVVAIILILVVLLQTGKRADLAGAFGGGGSQTAFGTRGAATFLSKMTTASAVVFMLTSLGLSIVSSQRGGGGSVLPADEPAPASVPAPASNPATDLPPLPESTAPSGAEQGGTSTPAESGGTPAPADGPAPEPQPGQQ